LHSIARAKPSLFLVVNFCDFAIRRGQQTHTHDFIFFGEKMAKSHHISKKLFLKKFAKLDEL
jgi:hypothetical protein